MRLSFFFRIGLVCLTLRLSMAIAQEVKVSINSGNPAFPFPQFLDYETNNHKLGNLGTKNAPGVTHAEMEQTIRDAWQIFANSFSYPGGDHAGVKYIKSNIGCPYDCTEGVGYAMIAAAYMADKTTFDGIWLYEHDKRMPHPRFKDGVNPYPNYKYGHNSVTEVGGNSAFDGDVDFAFGLLMAWKQWGDLSGYTNSLGQPISYKEEALKVIRGLVERQNQKLDPNRADCRSVSGGVGFDGYIKGGDTWTELTDWASTNDPLWCPEFKGPSKQHIDYAAPAYFRAFAKFLTEQGKSAEDLAWNIKQFERAEASSDWLMGKMLDTDGLLPIAGWVSLDANNKPTYSNFSDGEDFRNPWRTILNYVWHGNPTTSWNPTTHQVQPGANSYERDIAKRLATFVNNPSAAPWSNPCDEVGGGPSLTYSGPSQLKYYYNPITGKQLTTFPINYFFGTSTPASVAAEDYDLMGKLYRQCAIEWDPLSYDENDPESGYIKSVPKYFHGWFRLLGMLVVSGNHHSPMELVKESNVKVYHSLNKTYAFTGDQLVYTIKYRNYSSVNATNVRISTTLPKGLEFVSATGGGVHAGGTVSWNIGEVKGFTTAGGIVPTEGQVTFTVKVSTGFSGRICNSVTLTTDNGKGWVSNEYPNNQTAVLERNCVDIVEKAMKIDKTVNYKKVNPGNEVTYSVNFENASSGGFINGGRPGVNFAYAHDGTSAEATQHAIKLRLYHGAVEPYIDYGNYRISMFVNDNTYNCIVGKNGCTNGWLLDKDIYEGGDASKITISSEDIVPGSDARGAWNQRVIVQFANELSTTTQHLSRYFGMKLRVHQGGTQPLRVKWRLHSNTFGPIKWDDDWSWNADAKDYDDGLFYPITNDFTDIFKPNVPVTVWHNEACEKPTKFVDNILVEEWDGYTWRRIYGNGPLPGRDVNNVVVKDVLPVGFTFKGFIDENGVNVGSTITVLNQPVTYDAATRTITWKTNRLQIKQKGTIKYVATAGFSSGVCNRADELQTNTASIEGTNESPLTDTANVTVTCEEVILPPDASSMTKTADKGTYKVGDEITYTLKYTNTNGSIVNADLNSATNWKSQSGNPMNVSNGKLTSNPNELAVMTYNYAYGTNMSIETSVQFAGSQVFGFALRHTGGAIGNGIYVVFKPNPGAGDTKIRAYNGTTPLGPEATLGFSTNPATIKLELKGGQLNLWINNITNPTPTWTVANIPVRAGYAGVINGNPAGGDASGVHSLLKFLSKLDSGFDLTMIDPIPVGLTFVSASDGGKEVSGIVQFPSLAGPIKPNEEVTRTWVAKVTACPTSGNLVNNAYTNMMGQRTNSIGSQVIVFCGDNPPSCKAPTSVVTPIKLVQACRGGSDTLKATYQLSTGKTYRYVWYKKGAAVPNYANNTTYAHKTFSNLTVADSGTYIIRIEDGSTGLKTCYKEDSVRLKIDTLAPVLITPSRQYYCTYEKGVTLEGPTIANATYEWFKNGKSIGVASPNHVLINADSGQYTLQVTLGKCTQLSPSLTIAKQKPLGFIDQTGAPFSYCKGGTGVALHAIDAGIGADYKWLLNGAAFGSGPTLAQAKAGSYNIIVTTKVGCRDTSTATVVAESNGSSAPVTVRIEADKASYCEKEVVTLKAKFTNGGEKPTFQWALGKTMTSFTDSVFTSAVLKATDTVKVIFNSSEGCASVKQAEDTIVLRIMPNVKPTVKLKAVDAKVCAGQPITFKIQQQQNQGDKPTYEWFVDNASAGTKDSLVVPTITARTQVFVQLASNQACASPAKVNSDTVVVDVQTSVVPLVEIVADKPNVCSDNPKVTFTVSRLEGAGDKPAYQWLVDGQPVADSVADHFSTTSLTSANKVSVRLTSNSSCRSQDSNLSNELSINVIAKPQAKIVQPVANGLTHKTTQQSVNLQAETDAPAGYGALWQLTGQGTLTNSTGALNSLEGLSVAGTTEVRWIMADNGNVCKADTARIFIEYAEGPWAKVGRDTMVCEFSLPVLVGKGSATGVWSAITQGTSVSQNGTDATITNYLLGANTFIYKVTDDNLQMSVADTITITVVGKTMPTIKLTQNGLVGSCEGDTAQFTAEVAGGAGTINWFNKATGPTLKLGGWQNGTVVSATYVSHELCAVPKEVSDTIKIPLSSTARTDVQVTISPSETGSFCKGAVVEVKAEANVPNLTYNWNLNTGQQYNVASFSHTMNEPLAATLVVSATTGCFTTGTPLRISKSIEYSLAAETKVEFDATNGVFNERVCDTDERTFSATITGAISKYKWYVDGVLKDSIAEWVSSGLRDSAIIVLEVVPEPNCGSTVSDTAIVRVDERPRAGITAGNGIVYHCEGKDTVLLAVENNPEYGYSWIKKGELAGSTNTIAIADTGTYLLTIQNGACITPTRVRVDYAPIGVKIQTDHAEFYPGEVLELTAETSNSTIRNVVYSWWPIGITESPTAQITKVTPLETGFVGVIVRTIPEGCIAIDSIELKKRDKLFIPNAFTPASNDGNAVWGITGADNYPDMEIKVFNRWGSVVHEQKGYNKPWDGTLNGKPLPTGTYYFILKHRDLQKPMVGDLTIVR